jgi:hypothetical protein
VLFEGTLIPEVEIAEKEVNQVVGPLLMLIVAVLLMMAWRAAANG